jgi:hypothetical protein
MKSDKHWKPEYVFTILLGLLISIIAKYDK